MRNYSIYTLKTKLEFTNLYQYLSEKDYKQLEQQILCHSYHTPICTWNGIVINGIEAYELFRNTVFLSRKDSIFPVKKM